MRKHLLEDRAQILLMSLLVLPGPAAQAQVIAKSLPDARGRFTFEIALPAQAIYLADGYREWDDVVPVPPGTVCEVRSFIGWDRGTLAEGNLEVNVGAGFRLYERSEHRERARRVPDSYDAWASCAAPTCRGRVTFVNLAGGDLIQVHTGAVMTGPRTNDGGLSTRVQFAVRLRMSATRRCD